MPRFLTREEWSTLSDPMRVELSYQNRRGGQWEERPFVIDIDGGALAVLVESAALGHRLYEFMHLRRPGDLLRYWQVMTVVPNADLTDCVKRRLSIVGNHVIATHKAPLAISFATFDACFWQQEGRYVEDELDNMSRTWVEYRRRDQRPSKLDAMFEVVLATQARLRSSSDQLLRHELALIDSLRHSRDCWSRTGPAIVRSCMPVVDPTTDPELLELIVALACRPDVRSVSCPFDDRVLWRMLVWEQVQRATNQGKTPGEALFLAGPDSGMKDVEAEDWGGDIHVPYEGACAGDLFVKPHWHAFDRGSALAEGSVRAGLFGKAHRFALVQGDLGEFPRDRRARCGDWTLYSFPPP